MRRGGGRVMKGRGQKEERGGRIRRGGGLECRSFFFRGLVCLGLLNGLGLQVDEKDTSVENFIDTMFELCDVNHDDKISMEEFKYVFYIFVKPVMEMGFYIFAILFC
jgi:hypothetical protein